MGATVHLGQDRHSHELIRPLNFVSKTLERYFWVWLLAWMAIPCAFLICKSFNLFVPANVLSEQLTSVSSAIWPLFSEQYGTIRIAASPGEATNFTWFFIVMTAFSLVVAGFLLFSYSRNVSLICAPNAQELLAVALLILCALYVVKFDNALVHSKPFWDFFVDTLGLYYFRQAILLHLFFFAVTSAIVVAVAGARGVQRRLAG